MRRCATTPHSPLTPHALMAKPSEQNEDRPTAECCLQIAQVGTHPACRFMRD
jgi:hypothetical protein